MPYRKQRARAHCNGATSDGNIVRFATPTSNESNIFVSPNQSCDYFRVGTVGQLKGKGKGSPYSITERRVPELIPVLGSEPAGDTSHKPGGRLPLLFARPAVTLADTAPMTDNCMNTKDT